MTCSLKIENSKPKRLTFQLALVEWLPSQIISIMFVPHHGDYRSPENFKGLGWDGVFGNQCSHFLFMFVHRFEMIPMLSSYVQKGLESTFLLLDCVIWPSSPFMDLFFTVLFVEKKTRIPIKTHQHRHKRVVFLWWGGGEQLEFAEWSEGFSLSMPFGFNHLVEWWLVGTDVGFGPRGGWQKHVALALRRFLVSFFQKGIGFETWNKWQFFRKSLKPWSLFKENCDMSNSGPFFHVHPQVGLVSCDSDWHLLREDPLVDKLLSEACISDSGSVSVDSRSTGHVNFVWLELGPASKHRNRNGD